jgi:ATPase subunit of ABC transporter with duplicated ATPase domains
LRADELAWDARTESVIARRVLRLGELIIEEKPLHDAPREASAAAMLDGLRSLGLDAALPFADASGGRKRQALLARALVKQPDVLLLDEPTNHLDVAAIEWMEQFLIERGVTLLFVTHDRAFLRRVATRIVELDRGRLTSWPGDYQTFPRKKEEWLANEATQQAKFDKRLAGEEVWLRQGIKARRTGDGVMSASASTVYLGKDRYQQIGVLLRRGPSEDRTLRQLSGRERQLHPAAPMSQAHTITNPCRFG